MAAEWLKEIGGADSAAALLLAFMALRGLWLGALRQMFSLGALAAAWFVVQKFMRPFAEWLGAFAADAGMELAPPAALALSVLLLVAATVLGVGLLGRLVRGAFSFAGLGFFDRLAGALFGAGKGALILLLLMFGLEAAGITPPALADSRTFAYYESAREWWLGE